MPLNNAPKNFTLKISTFAKYCEIVVKSLNVCFDVTIALFQNSLSSALAIQQPLGSQSPLCYSILQEGTLSDGIYEISINGKPEQGYCEFTNDQKAWLVGAAYMRA